MAATAILPALVALAGDRGRLPWLQWAAVPVGLLTGIVLWRHLGRRAATRLDERQVGALRLLAGAP